MSTMTVGTATIDLDGPTMRSLGAFHAQPRSHRLETVSRPISVKALRERLSAERAASWPADRKAIVKREHAHDTSRWQHRKARPWWRTRAGWADYVRGVLRWTIGLMTGVAGAALVMTLGDLYMATRGAG